MTKNITEGIRLRLVKIRELKFSLNQDYNSLESANAEEAPFDILVKYDFASDMDSDLFSINIGIKYCDENDNDNIILDTATRFTFKIENLKNYITVNKTGNMQIVGYDFVPTLLNVVMGTMRGLIFAKTAMTPLVNHPMPLIDINELTAQSKTR